MAISGMKKVATTNDTCSIDCRYKLPWVDDVSIDTTAQQAAGADRTKPFRGTQGCWGGSTPASR